MSSVNDTQVGGSHYRSDLQHWDLMEMFDVRYLEANTIRYLTRWRAKGGVVDLRKADHYVEKIIEGYRLRAGMSPWRRLWSRRRRPTHRRVDWRVVETFFDANHVRLPERYCIAALLSHREVHYLLRVREHVSRLIQVAEAANSTGDTGEVGLAGDHGRS